MQDTTTTQTLTGRDRLIGLVLATLGCAVAIGACGSASSIRSSSALTGQSHPTAVLAFASCMRSHGVPSFPDLSSTGGLRIGASGQTLTVNGVSINAPAFEAARTQCQRYLPHVHPSQAQIAQQTRKGLEFARCMRSHGVPNFPDPKATTGTNGNGVVDLRNAGLNFQSPAFKTAANACGGFAPKGPP